MGPGHNRFFLAAVVLGLALLTGVAVAGTSGVAATDTTTALEESADYTTLEGADASTLYAADHDHVHECAAEPPADFSAPADGNDTIGWFDGYWYNQPLDIDATDGLTEDELEQVSARTAARFEALRCLTFEEIPPVEIVDREAFAEETTGQYGEVDEQTRLFDNAQFEALLLIGGTEDSVEVREADRSATVGGYYDFINDEVVVISDDPDQLQLDEAILAHELGHALQNQHFDLARYERNTRDLDNGKLGVIEGDVHRVEQQYLEYCEEGVWNEPCILDDAEAGAGAGEPPSWGLYFMQFQPYSDGPNFIDHVYEQGGWDAVNAVYDDMPRSAVEIIYPERYGEFTVADLEVPDRSDDDWERMNFEDEPDYNVIGQAGLSAILMEPAYDFNPIVPQEEFLNIDPETGDIDQENPLNYDLEATSGWEGDKLYVYENDGQAGAVWKLAWEDAEDATTFLDAYEQLIDHRGGEHLEGSENTYVFDDGSDFDMAMTVIVDDDRLWIVTAPSLEDLGGVHADVESVEPPADDDDDTADDEAGDDAANDDDTTDDSIPGFGPAVAVAALLAVGFVARVGDNRPGE
ncbi:Hvo_1808 family surface protein [Natrialbaceae archaeon A-chndr2]